MSACSTCDDEGVVDNTEDGEPWSAWANLPPESNMAVRFGLVKPIPCPAECARGIIAAACMLQTGSPFPPARLAHDELPSCPGCGLEVGDPAGHQADCPEKDR